MFDHTLNVIKGPGQMHRLDHHAPPAENESILFGMVMSKNQDGNLVAGCPAGAHYNRPMPMFAIQNRDDFDANSDVGNISGGVMSGIVATGGFEVETTEFVGDTYNVNDMLTAENAGLDKGKVKKAASAPYQQETVCGVVSKKVITNTDGIQALTFWTVYLPASIGTQQQESSSSDESSTSA